MNYVILGLGSNKSWNGMNSIQLLKKAYNELSFLISKISCSSVYRTKPMYVENQDDFYNMVVSGFVEDSFVPEELLQKIHIIESSLGRDRSKEIRNGPRSIDIDIEVFGNISVQTKDLQIPHPRIFERNFVLCPMLEIFDKSADFIIKENLLQLATKKSFSDVEIFLGIKDFIKTGV